MLDPATRPGHGHDEARRLVAELLEKTAEFSVGGDQRRPPAHQSARHCCAEVEGRALLSVGGAVSGGHWDGGDCAAARRIRSVTASGWASMATWEESISTVCDPARLAS